MAVETYHGRRLLVAVSISGMRESSVSNKARGRSVRAKTTRKATHAGRPSTWYGVGLLQAANSMANWRRGSPRLDIAITCVRCARMFGLTHLARTVYHVSARHGLGLRRGPLPGARAWLPGGAAPSV